MKGLKWNSSSALLALDTQLAMLLVVLKDGYPVCSINIEFSGLRNWSEEGHRRQHLEVDISQAAASAIR